MRFTMNHFCNNRRDAESAFRASQDKFYNDIASEFTDPNTSAKTFLNVVNQYHIHFVITATSEKAEAIN